MKVKEKAKLLFKSLFIQLGSLTTDEGIQLLWNEDGDLMPGYEVFVENILETGEIEYVAPADGEYKVGNMIYVIEDGLLQEIKETEPEQNPEEMAEQEPEETQEPEKVDEPAKDFTEDINNINVRISEMETAIAMLQQQMASLLETPADENVFSKTETETFKEQKQSILKIKK